MVEQSASCASKMGVIGSATASAARKRWVGGKAMRTWGVLLGVSASTRSDAPLTGPIQAKGIRRERLESAEGDLRDSRHFARDSRKRCGGVCANPTTHGSPMHTLSLLLLLVLGNTHLTWANPILATQQTLANIVLVDPQAKDQTQQDAQAKDQAQDPRYLRWQQQRLQEAMQQQQTAKATKFNTDTNDPNVLKFQAEKIHKIREKLDSFSGPPPIDLMREALAIAMDETLELAVRGDALEQLQELVEDLDNARDFAAIKGFHQIVNLFDDAPSLRASTAWVLGTAAQNNEDLQRHMLIDVEALAPLLSLLRTVPDAKGALHAKVLYAVSSLVRTHPEGHRQFEEKGGVDTLIGMLDATRPLSTRLVKKSAVLVGDLLGLLGVETGVELGEDLRGKHADRSGSSFNPLATSLQRALSERAVELCSGVARLLSAGEEDVDSGEKGVFLGIRLLGAGFDFGRAGCESIGGLVSSFGETCGEGPECGEWRSLLS